MGIYGKIVDISKNDPFSWDNLEDNAELFLYFIPAYRIEAVVSEALINEYSI